MASTEKSVVETSTSLFEMEDCRLSTSQQKPDPTKPAETGPVVIEEAEHENKSSPRKYLTGWQLRLLTIGVWIALFLSTIETTIVSTSLVSITNALNGFFIKDWVVTAYLLTYTAILQLIGVGLSCSYPTDQTKVPPSQYGFEVIMGLGFGLGLTTLLTFARAVVEEKHTAVMMGAITQIRVLGGTISLAICATILNNHVKPRIQSIVSPEQAQVIYNSLSAIQDLNPSQQAAVKRRLPRVIIYRIFS